MFIRFKIWKARHMAKVVSKHHNGPVDAKVGNVRVGTYRRGKPIA